MANMADKNVTVTFQRLNDSSQLINYAQAKSMCNVIFYD